MPAFDVIGYASETTRVENEIRAAIAAHDPELAKICTFYPFPNTCPHRLVGGERTRSVRIMASTKDLLDKIAVALENGGVNEPIVLIQSYRYLPKRKTTTVVDKPTT